MKIHQFHIPTNLYLGPVNVYLVDEDPLTLIDTGPNLPESLEALRDSLNAVGRRVADLERIVLTHVHEDHSGLANKLQQESGAAIFAHPWEADRLRDFEDYHLYVPLLERAGVPPAVIEVFRKGYLAIRRLGDELQDIEGLEDGDQVDFDRCSFSVVHTPGHTPGSICLFREADRLLIAADTVLKNITPNPVLSPDPFDQRRRFPSLGEYLVSLARLRSLAPTVVKGGHGSDVDDFESYFLSIVRFTDERQKKLASLLPREGTSAWEASLALFPVAEREHRFLALSETLAHLDFGVAEGRFAVEERDEVEVFTRLRAS
jgi:glyoxylase-like metal-dependent hydrolase (beta-lactamase superfamily II)